MSLIYTGAPESSIHRVPPRCHCRLSKESGSNEAQTDTFIDETVHSGSVAENEHHAPAVARWSCRLDGNEFARTHIKRCVQQVHPYIELLANLLGMAGAAIIFIGVALASFWFVGNARRGSDWRSGYQGYRANLGRGILLGLELLVGGDIIRTITAPLTFGSVGFLAVIIVVRTLLSFSLDTEINGCWPWQRRTPSEEGAKNAGSQR